ncbi:MAG TPA: hypothetical protein DIU15_13615 [Deltaproteobacteria bacterium]|nr:hypothetical protein [Deltaproteobacteria bacterium]HCP47078.1 hypothetical protein [Deltaproteobacteria bacterium]
MSPRTALATKHLSSLLALTFVALMVALAGGACDATPSDDDDDRVIPPADGCSNTSLENVTFELTIHWAGEDYPPDQLASLVASWNPPALNFPFLGLITEKGDDPDSNRKAITLTEQPPPDSPPIDDPNWVRIVYSMPLGYDLPGTLGEEIGVHTIIDYTTGVLLSGFSLWEILEDGSGALMFLAEPSDVGLAYLPGEEHPAFQGIEVRDRACPNANALQCASAYNLSVTFETRAPATGDDDDSSGDDDDSSDASLSWEVERFELFPTEHKDFTVDGLDLRVVNVWSYAYREVNPDCTGFDWDAERFSYFITRTDAAPPEGGTP